MAYKETGLRIRPMEPDDLVAVSAIDRKIRGGERTPTYQDPVNEMFGGQMGISFVAEADDRIVGLALARIAYVPERIAEVCLIQVLGVDPEYKGRGIATTLVQSVIDGARAKGMRTAYVMIDKQDDKLQSLFERMGFSQGHLVHYTKDI